MKKMFLFALTAAALASCSKMETEVSPVAGNSFLSLKVGTETRTALQSDGSVFWMTTDTLVVFDQDNTPVKFGTPTSNVKEAEFTTNSWTGGIPKYAASFRETESAVCTSDGVISLRVDNSQNIIFKKNYSKHSSVCVGTVTGSEGSYSISEMKNVNGLIKYSILLTHSADSVAVEAVGGESLAGYVNVDCKKIGVTEDFWTSTAGKSQYSRIVMTPDQSALNAGAGFVPGDYYAVVLPQKYEKGLRFIVYGRGGDTLAVNTVGAAAGVTVKRSEILAVNGSVDLSTPNVPDSFTLDLKFNLDEKAFGTLINSAKQTTTLGERYSITYSENVGGVDYNQVFDFVACKGTTAGASYSYMAANGSLAYSQAKGWLRIPAVKGRRLKSISVKIGNAYAKTWLIVPTLATYDSAALKTVTSPALGAATATFEASEVSAGTPYYLRVKQAMQISELQIEYCK